MKDINVAISIGCTWEYLPVQFFHSWIGMAKPKHSVIFGNRGRFDDMKNNNVREILKDPSFTHILFLDVDHYHHPETLRKLLSDEKQIVSGLSFRRSPPYDPIMFKYDEEKNYHTNITEWIYGDVLEVDAVGAASLLVDIEVFRNMPAPWFEFTYRFDEEGKKIMTSEDFTFCMKAKKLGYKIFVDTSVTNKHLSTLEVDEETWIKNGREINV